MSAIQLLEQLGASAPLQRNQSAEAAAIRQQAMDAMENMESPIHQWCLIVPAEEEGEEGDGENKEGEDKDSEQIRLN